MDRVVCLFACRRGGKSLKLGLAAQSGFADDPWLNRGRPLADPCYSISREIRRRCVRGRRRRLSEGRPRQAKVYRPKGRHNIKAGSAKKIAPFLAAQDEMANGVICPSFV